MTTTVFLAVIGAAALHAAWNALLKAGSDKFLGMTAVVLGHAPFGAAAVVLAPIPDPASWGLLAGGVLLHVGYQWFLLASYDLGDLTQVYPIARGSAPLIVAAVSVGFLGVELSFVEQLSVLLIGLGIISLSLVRQGDGMRNRPAAFYAAVTGCFIAGYSLVDGLGARAAGTALGFFGWLTIGNALLFAVLSIRTRPDALRQVWREHRNTALLGGGASFVAYALVVWAFTQAPIALVTALRETSIVFALLIGVVFLRERIDLYKLAATFLAVSGAALLRLGRH